MRLLTLYMRSRAVPQALVGIALVAMGMLLVDDAVWLVVSAAGLGVAMASSGLGGHDVELDRTATIPWIRWRVIHLAAIAGTVVLSLGWQDTEVVVRASVGLTGLAALGVTFLGRELAWLPPVTWTACTVVLPVSDDVVTWLVRPPGTIASTVTASVFGLVGLVFYAAFGPRRGTPNE